MRGGGAWRGAMGSVGGVPRTFGLGGHFSREGLQGPPPRITWAQIRRVGRYFVPYRLAWLVILGCILVSAVLHVLPPLCVRYILDDAIPHKNFTLLSLLAGAMVVLAVSAGLVSVLQQTLTARTGQSIMFDLRNELFCQLQRMGLRFFTATRSGEIVSRINNDVGAVQGVATGTVVSIASNLATLSVTATAMLSMNWRLTVLAVAVVPAFYVPSRIVGSIRRRLSRQTQESHAAMLGFLNERMHVGGALLTDIYGQRQADAQRFAQTAAQVRELHVKQAIVGRWLFMILSSFGALGPAAIYWYGGYQAIESDLSTGTLVAFAALLGLLYRPLIQLASVYVDIQGAMAVFERIFEYLDMTPGVTDQPGARALPAVQGHIRFEDVSFTYPTSPLALRWDGGAPAAMGGATSGGNGQPAAPAANVNAERFAIQNVSFEIKPGQRVALVGPSGAGKTTLTYLLPRFYDPDAGRITLDGHDLRELQQESVRRHIGVVTQETFLFHASIRENLLYARPDAGESQLIDACRAANIHDFIQGLPEAYDTVVGERGFRLSGGEKQRLSIARALLKDPAILILDEATSSLDATTEYLIQSALEKLLCGRTSLIIAHRLSTILSADQIVVMQAGRVVDRGRHEDLLAHEGLYAQLFHQQFGRVLGLEVP